MCVSFMSLHTHSEVCEQVAVFVVCVHVGKVCDTPIPARMAMCACLIVHVLTEVCL